MTQPKKKSLRHKWFVISLYLFTLLFCFGYKAYAGESIWVDAFGEAVTDDKKTISDIKEEALSKARRAAIEQVVGVKVQGETILRNFAMQSDFVTSLSTGHIVEEKIIKWETDPIKRDDINTPLMVYRVLLKAKVALENGTPDPSFKIYASTNRSVFKNGDGVALRVLSTKNCYITVFVVTENNNVYLILPNKYKKSNYLKEGEEFFYPSENDVSKGLTLKAGFLPGSKKAKEFFRVIATKKPINFTPEMFAEGIGLESFTQETATVSELVKELMMIPADERTEAVIAYEVVK